MLCFSIKPVLAEEIWYEDFSGGSIFGASVPEHWETSAFRRSDKHGDGAMVPLTEEKYQIRVRNGLLSSTYYDPSEEGGYLSISSMAFCNSAQIYGHWSFDWFVFHEAGRNNTAIDFFYISLSSLSGNWNADGMSENEFFADKVGYILMLVSQTTYYGGYGFNYPLIEPQIIILVGESNLYSEDQWNPTPRIAVPLNATVEGRHHIDIFHNENQGFAIYYDQKLLNQGSRGYRFLGSEGINNIGSQKIGYASVSGESGIDNIRMNITTPTDIFDEDLLVIEEISSDIPLNLLITGALGVTITTYWFTGGRKRTAAYLRHRRNARARAILETFSDIFSPKQLAYLAILGQKSQDGQPPFEKTLGEIPSKLIEYKFLMQPVRLSIMNLLHKHFTLTSVQIKDELRISWGNYSSHISALEKKGFLSTYYDFLDGSKVQMVVLEEVGRKEYESLTELLQEFLMNQQGSDLSSVDLYPENP